MSLSQNSLRVLVVEDSFLLAEALCDLLRENDLEPVGPAGTAEAALVMLRNKWPIDVAVLDMRLHRGDSLALAKILSKAGVSLVFLTGCESIELPASLVRVPVLQKPCEPQALIQAIRCVAQRDITARQFKRA